MTDLQIFESCNPVSSGWALGQAKHSVLREGAARTPEAASRRLASSHPRASGDGVRAQAAKRGWVSLCDLQAGVGCVAVCWGQPLAPVPRVLQTTPQLTPCLLRGESFPLLSQTGQCAYQNISLIRLSVLILVRTVYLRLLPGFANCFPFSREPKMRWCSQPEL